MADTDNKNNISKDDKTGSAEKTKAENSKPSDEGVVFPHVKRGFAVAVISVFMAILVLPTLIWGALLLVDQVNPEIMEALNFDTGENREMAKFPSEFNAKTITSEIESWYNDNLPFRSVLYKTQEVLKGEMEKPYQQKVMPALIELFHGSQSSTSEGESDTFDELFGNQTEETTAQETETLPEFETDEQPSDCQHLYAEDAVVVQEATCSDWGVIGYTCTKCDYIGNKEYTQKLSHDYVSSVKTPPLCGTSYQETRVCSICRYRVTDIQVKKHVAGETLKTVEPSMQDYGYTLVRCADCKMPYRTQLKNKLADTSYLPPILHNATLEGKQNWLFYTGDNSIGYYTGSNHLSAYDLEQYAAILNRFHLICEEKGIQVAIAFWPNKELVYPEYMPDYEIVNTVKRVELLTQYVNTYSTVPAVYPLAQLKAAKPYAQVYYKHDTHWNLAGGFVGTMELYKALGFETMELTNVPFQEAARTGGDLINIGGLNAKNYTGDTNYSFTYRPEVTVKSVNTTPVNSHTTHTTSNGKYDLNFVMLSDSFRGSMRYFLERDFTDCLLTHRSQVLDSDVVAAIKEADVLVISAVERYDYSVFATIQTIINILTQE